VDYGERSRAIRAEYELRIGIQATGIGTESNARHGDNLAAVGIDDHHQPVIANRKEARLP
jgi:hypothetical protein